jgi:hypothetical protein
MTCKTAYAETAAYAAGSLTPDAGPRSDGTPGQSDHPEDAMSTQATTPETHTNGAGAPRDLPTELVATLRTEAQPPAGGLVAPAFSLGWYLHALCRQRGTHVSDALASDFADVSERDSVAFCLRQVEVACKRLAEIVEKAGQTRLDPGALAAAVRDDRAHCDSARELHRDAFAILSAVDARLGRAYRLGAQLLDLTVPPPKHRPLDQHLGTAAVAPAIHALDDLASAFPPHAGHSVCRSLNEWRKTAAGTGVGAELAEKIARDDPELWACLRRQGQLWRALLSGEKVARDMLELGCYLDAAEGLSRRIRTIAFHVLRDYPLAVAVAVALFVVGALALIGMRDDAATVAGAGAILASLGLTWKGLGAALGRIAKEVEEPLWGAEIDLAVTRQITLIKLQTGKRDPSRERRDLAIAWDRARPGAPTEPQPPAAQGPR